MKKKSTIILLLSILLILSIGINVAYYIKGNQIETSIISAEKLFNLNFTDSERDSLTDDLIQNIEKYKAIHKFDIPNNLPPSLIFSPVPVGYSPNFDSKVTDFDMPKGVTLPQNIEDVCFYTVSELSELIKSGQISSEELTLLYLNRLKQHDPQLHCVITLLEERALEQARAMDAELKQGKYRGPLHGIPYGVKDLLALKGYPFTFG